VLPHHSPLFTRLTIGDFIYRIKGVEHHVVVTQGFMDISPENTATVIVDSATHERDLSLVKAQAAVAAAQETMQLSRDKRELLLAEASLKQALLAVKVAQRTKRGASL
jgi:F-type H+-transporting ATPase subunit epsilon